MHPFIQTGIFPIDIETALTHYLANPAASSCTDLNLFRVLKKCNMQSDSTQSVEQLPDDTIFALKNGRVFQKKEKIRKRYRCIELTTQRIYLFSPIAEVILLESPNNSVI